VAELGTWSNQSIQVSNTLFYNTTSEKSHSVYGRPHSYKIRLMRVYMYLLPSYVQHTGEVFYLSYVLNIGVSALSLTFLIGGISALSHIF
jgi:hypothetical protein